MLIEVRIQHRPGLQEDVDARFSNTVSAISGLQQLPVNKELLQGAALEKSGTGASASMNGLFGKGLFARLAFSARKIGYLQDKALYDDSLIFELDTDALDYRYFVREALPGLVEAFDAYRAVILLDKDLDLDDYERIVQLSETSKKNIDGRDTVYRINSVNYFDRELCRRAFASSPEEIVEALKGKAESARVFHDGVLLVYSSELLPRDKIEKIDSEIRPLIQRS